MSPTLRKGGRGPSAAADLDRRKFSWASRFEPRQSDRVKRGESTTAARPRRRATPLAGAAAVGLLFFFSVGRASAQAPAAVGAPSPVAPPASAPPSAFEQRPRRRIGLLAT